MKFNLLVINTSRTEVHPDLTFDSMEELEKYVNSKGYIWTSLVITVLPRDRHIRREWVK